MPSLRNNAKHYDARLKAPAPAQPGIRQTGHIEFGAGERTVARRASDTRALAFAAMVLGAALALCAARRMRRHTT